MSAHLDNETTLELAPIKAASVRVEGAMTGVPEKEEVHELEAAGARRAWSDQLCAWLSEAVAHQAPGGLGHWEPAWQIVETPSKTLLEALTAFELSGSDSAREQARQLAREVLNAWSEAAAEWERAGKPLPESETPA